MLFLVLPAYAGSVTAMSFLRDRRQHLNAIGPTALGKKYWLFFGSDEAGQRSAVICMLTAYGSPHTQDNDRKTCPLSGKGESDNVSNT